MKTRASDEGSIESHQVDGNNIHYVLTLDPTIRDHRIIALIINHTSKDGDCPFYASENQMQCKIAQEPGTTWKDCEGKCFIQGLTCPAILGYLDELGVSKAARRDYQESGGNAKKNS